MDELSQTWLDRSLRNPATRWAAVVAFLSLVLVVGAFNVAILERRDVGLNGISWLTGGLVGLAVVEFFAASKLSRELSSMMSQRPEQYASPIEDPLAPYGSLLSDLERQGSPADFIRGMSAHGGKVYIYLRDLERQSLPADLIRGVHAYGGKVYIYKNRAAIEVRAPNSREAAKVVEKIEESIARQ